jgi:predicted RNA-binding protein YlxR (DUF448 family)
LRFVARAGLAVPDPQAKLPGRGAYLCREGEGPKGSCLERALRRGSLSRTLRSRVVAVWEAVESSNGG